MAAHTMHSRNDPLETTAAARTTFWESFLDLVDPRRELPEQERIRRAKSARKAHLARLEYQRLRAESLAAEADS